MAKNVREQLDYGNTPERMDPNLEKKLASPESLYGSNPAMKKGPADVQRLVSQRFQKVADKLRQVTKIENLSSKQVQGMVYEEMMAKLPMIMQIESKHKEELEELAKQASMEETEIPEGWVKIIAELGSRIDTSNFQMEPKKEKEDEEDKEPKLEIPSFDVSDLTDEEEFELEKHKRNIINAIIQGAAKKGHYVFQKPNIKERLNEIDPRLYSAYLGIMSINDFMYFTMEQMIEMMSQTGNGVAGKVELDPDDEDGGGEGEEGDDSDTVIKAQGMIFPILCHEIIKGIEESKGRHGLPSSDTMRDRVKGAVDILPNEPMQLRIGPEISEKLRRALPDQMFDESNKGLINWFHILLYQVPAQEFLDIIGNAISEDESKVKKATSRFEEIMREAIQMKKEFDEYKEDNDSSDFSSSNDFGDDDNDDDLDDFLGSLGITRPKYFN
jgi:hypothetical protein